MGEQHQATALSGQGQGLFGDGRLTYGVEDGVHSEASTQILDHPGQRLGRAGCVGSQGFGELPPLRDRITHGDADPGVQGPEHEQME